ncbi:MAG TPA: FkbM family methyltransferase [Terriglobales bacterium]|nr:FkbM family methyltransferase [Terriglobales bacterium]
MAKSLMPFASSCLMRMRMQTLVRYTELGSSLLQGKGAGSGWDMRSELRAAAACITRPDPVLLDVGANRGKWSRGMLRLFPATKRMILIEPQNDCLAVLDTLELPGKLIVPCAVSDHSGEEPFHTSGMGCGAASLYARNETFFAARSQKEITVPVTTLDAVFEREGIQYVDFAKFDIEGAELSAFHGAARSFSCGAFGALSFEFGSGNINSRTFFRDFWALFTEWGFEVFRVLPGGQVLRIDQYYEDLEYFRGVSNYICRRKPGRDVRKTSIKSLSTPSLCAKTE